MLLMETNLIDSVKQRIKKHEGYRDTVYLCSEGFRTIGYGHRCFDDEDWKDNKKYKWAFTGTPHKSSRHDLLFQFSDIKPFFLPQDPKI